MADPKSALQIYIEAQPSRSDATNTSARDAQEIIDAIKYQEQQWMRDRFGRTSDALIEFIGPQDIAAPFFTRALLEGVGRGISSTARSFEKAMRPYNTRSVFKRSESMPTKFRSGAVPMHDFDFADPALHSAPAGSKQFTITKEGGLDEVTQRVQPLVDAGHDLRIYQTPGGYRVFDRSTAAKEMTPRQYFYSSLSPGKKVAGDPLYKEMTANEVNGPGYWFRVSEKPGRENDFIARFVKNIPGKDKDIFSSIEVFLNHDIPVKYNLSELSKRIGKLSDIANKGGEQLRYLAQQFNISDSALQRFIAVYKTSVDQLRLASAPDKTPQEIIEYLISNTKDGQVREVATNFIISGKKFPGVVSVFKDEKKVLGNVNMAPGSKPLTLLDYILWRYGRHEESLFGYEFAKHTGDPVTNITNLTLFQKSGTEIPSSAFREFNKFLPKSAVIDNTASSYSADSAPMLASLVRSGKSRAAGDIIESRLNHYGQNTMLSKAWNEGNETLLDAVIGELNRKNRGTGFSFFTSPGPITQQRSVNMLSPSKLYILNQ